MIRFREKTYGVAADTAKAGITGASIGIGLNKIGNAVLGGKDKSVGYLTEAMSSASNTIESILSKSGSIGEYLKGVNKSFWDRLSKIGKWILTNPAKAGLIGAAVGASLAVGYYLIKKSYNKADQMLVGFRGKMLDLVTDTLRSMGYERDKDFTTDPAQADYLKTKVCIVVSSSKDELSLTINSISDPKLDSISKQIIKNLPSGTKFYKKESDKSNELSLALIPTSNGDYAYIATIAERFIKRKYPVFLLEIN